MRIYFDENFSPHLIRGLREFQLGRRRENFEVMSIKEEFGQGTKDEDWIPKVAQAHGVAVTFDLNINRLRAQRHLWSGHRTNPLFGWNTCSGCRNPDSNATNAISIDGINGTKLGITLASLRDTE